MVVVRCRGGLSLSLSLLIIWQDRIIARSGGSRFSSSVGQWWCGSVMV